ncbi:porin family protein [Hymenobacter daeguensis]
MKNLFTALLLTAATATTVQAQTAVTFGPRLGLNVTTSANSGTPSGFNQGTKSVVGLQLGGTLNIGLGEHLAFQPSLLFTQKGMESTGSETDLTNPPYKTTITISATTHFNYLELPLNFVYTTGGTDGFQVFAGPYVAMGVGGNGSYKGSLNSTDPNLSFFNGDYPGSLTIEYGDKQNDNSALNNGNSTSPTIVVTARRFDAGLNGGVGYRVGPFQAQLGYGLGLVNFVPNDSDGTDTGSKSYHRGFQLSANYFFGGK